MKKIADVQGQNANKAGKWLEDEVEDTLNACGITSIQNRDLGDDVSLITINFNPKGVLIKNAPYINSYGKNARGEFLLRLKAMDDCRIECRAQWVRGSAEDKLMKLLKDCEVMVENNVIIVLEGDGFSKEAVKWIYDAAAMIKHKNIVVKTLEEFKSWAFTNFGTKVKKSITMVNVPQRFTNNRPVKCNTYTN